MTSKKFDSSTNTENEREGVLYFLPRVKLHVTAIKADEIETNAMVTEAETNVNSVSNQIITNTVASKGDAKSTNVLAINNSTNVLRISNHVLNESTNHVYNISVEQIFERDPEQMYLLRTKHIMTADDSFGISLTNGFLNSINSSNVDKTGEIFIKIAQIGVETFKLVTGFGLSEPGADESLAKPDFPQVIDVTFDPMEKEDWKMATIQFRRANIFLYMPDRDSFPYPEAASTASKADRKGAVSTPTINGIVYRPLLPYEFTMSSSKISDPALLASRYRAIPRTPDNATADEPMSKAGGASQTANTTASSASAKPTPATPPKAKPALAAPQTGKPAPTTPPTGKPAQTAPPTATPTVPETASGTHLQGIVTKTVLLPNKAPILTYDVTRAPFVTKNTQVYFENGTIKEVHLNQESELSALLDVPVSILKTIASIPTDLVQLKFNLTTTNTALIQAQKAQIDALQQLLNSERGYYSDLKTNTSGAP